jgi:hypothetical protein
MAFSRVSMRVLIVASADSCVSRVNMRVPIVAPIYLQASMAGDTFLVQVYLVVI